MDGWMDGSMDGSMAGIAALLSWTGVDLFTDGTGWDDYDFNNTRRRLTRSVFICFDKYF